MSRSNKINKLKHLHLFLHIGFNVVDLYQINEKRRY